MKRRYVAALALFPLIQAFGASGIEAQARQPAPALKGGVQARQPEEPLDIWQIDLVPTGTGFALTTPVLQGDVYVFRVWPDREIVRLPKSRVKKMLRRTKDVSNEFLYQIDLLPSGQTLARDKPALKGTTYQFHSWKGGTLMSVRQTDVKTITRVAGLEAFKIHLQQLGARTIGDLPMQGGGAVVIVGGGSSGSQAAAPPGQSHAPGNWIYEGVPGVTEAWAPANAVINAPGDVPRAAPQPH